MLSTSRTLFQRNFNFAFASAGRASAFTTRTTTPVILSCLLRCNTTSGRLFSTTTTMPQAHPKLNISDPTPLLDSPTGFSFIRSNPRDPKPRNRGVTEIRGPYYSVMGPRYLSDILETVGHHVDGLKFAGGSFSLLSEEKVKELIEIAHSCRVYASTGGWVEHILASTSGGGGGEPKTTGETVDKYLEKCKELGFDVVELSTGFISLPPGDFENLIKKVQSHNLIPKPELGIQFGAGGDTPQSSASLPSQQSSPSKLISLANHFVKDLGVPRIMIESEGITENVPRESWRTDVIYRIMDEVGIENVMFEAADPQVFDWYVREFGIDVNLFVDHSQIVQLSALRSGIWGTAETFGKICSFRPEVQAGRGRVHKKGDQGDGECKGTLGSGIGSEGP